MDRMVHLLSCGYAVPVTNYMCECAERDNMDTSVIRHFVQEVSSHYCSLSCLLLRNVVQLLMLIMVSWEDIL